MQLSDFLDYGNITRITFVIFSWLSKNQSQTLPIQYENKTWGPGESLPRRFQWNVSNMGLGVADWPGGLRHSGDRLMSDDKERIMKEANRIVRTTVVIREFSRLTE